MKNFKISYFFNWFFFLSLSLTLLFNDNLFSNITEGTLQKTHQKLLEKTKRNLAEGTYSSKISRVIAKSSNSTDIRERVNSICECLYMAYKDTANWFSHYEYNDPESKFKNSIIIGDQIERRLSWEGFKLSYKLIRDEIIRTKERNDLVASVEKTKSEFTHMMSIFQMENDLTKDLLNNMIGKPYDVLETLINDEEKIVKKIKEELQKRNLNLPPNHIHRMALRISRRAHDIGYEEGILDKYIPEPQDCYLEEFKN
ncbi:hypothetical protein PGAL8A_00178100 [Plasmodium gallinaceum]|uniref:Uncharacterized protein n=1 Tax=Plasmodium gallinaceum TaxID=5849 RepID=A0A1J1GNU2_PLAGA|nr:hypothetical protein PGAL8A_00178100 [Plasmodium gallinaceum]CRG94069.1 hypothetical protein PGAL8A_00178100 [Plasmodium gallinaceum]